MSDSGYGVYVSIRNVDGALWSSSREEWALTRTDLETAFGEDFTNALVDSLRKVFVKGQSNVVQLPVAAPAHPSAAPVIEVEASEEAAMALAEEILAAGSPVDVDAPSEQPQFEPCEKCGQPKTEWKPPGVSKTSGKKYPGFFGCPNFRNHPR